MIQFINPIAGSKITEIPGSKSVMLTPNYGSPILSPYKGIVYNVNNDSIVIQHSLNNQYVYSKFKGINRFQVGVNVPLKQGESFAYGDTTDIEYSILDENDKKLNVMKFINGFDDNTSKTDDKDDKDDKDEKKKGTTPKIPGKSYTSDFLTHVALKPFEFIHNKIRFNTDEEEAEARMKKEKEQKEKDDANFEKKLQKVNEEINRIKQLLK
jgi:hypothetical protein